MQIQIYLPEKVRYILETYQKHGYQAFAVGGCIRDSIIGKEPIDWDICTSAIPSQTIGIFTEHKIIKTGMKHGTVTLLMEDETSCTGELSIDRLENLNSQSQKTNTSINYKHFEITTYRIEGNYTDNRHPDEIEYVKEIEIDLSRRDFTINALAYNQEHGLLDYFNGIDDLKNGIIKCVGNPDKRFHEDALRILRALRFASVLNFDIEAETKKSIFENKKLLHNISTERITIELNKLLLGDGVGKIINNFFCVFEEFIPELSPLKGFDQKNPFHCFDVLTHTLKSIDFASKDLLIRLAMLFHDIGKPECYTEQDGIGHFYGHASVSEKKAFERLTKLKYDNETKKIVSELILYHNLEVLPEEKNIKKWLRKIGAERLRQLLEVKKADILAKAHHVLKCNLCFLEESELLLEEIISQEQCFSLKNLAITGKDLLELGIQEGKTIGDILNILLDKVINNEISNEKDALLGAIKDLTHF